MWWAPAFIHGAFPGLPGLLHAGLALAAPPSPTLPGCPLLSLSLHPGLALAAGFHPPCPCNVECGPFQPQLGHRPLGRGGRSIFKERCTPLGSLKNQYLSLAESVPVLEVAGQLTP